MLRIIKRFGEHCSCHPQGECIVVRPFFTPYVGQAVRVEVHSMAPSSPSSHVTPVCVRLDTERGVNPRKGWRSVINPPPLRDRRSVITSFGPSPEGKE